MDFLVKPFQRLLKYPLFLRVRLSLYNTYIQELVKYTPPSHPDCQNIIQSLRKMQVEVDKINMDKAKADNLKKMLEINSLVEGANKLKSVM
jgi:hypothetical protein